MRRLPTLLVSALAIVACSRHTPSPQEGPIAVAQFELRAAPMFFHPDLPLVGQEDGARCDVWDLTAKLYRGSVELRTCQSWVRSPAPLAPELAEATPHEPIADADRADPNVDALLWATSRDGRWIATARGRGMRARVWDARSRALVEEVTIPSSAYDTKLEGLMWIHDGSLVLVTTGEGPWLVRPRGGHPRALASRRPDRYLRFFIDPAGRYLGALGKDTDRHFHSRSRLSCSLTVSVHKKW